MGIWMRWGVIHDEVDKNGSKRTPTILGRRRSSMIVPSTIRTLITSCWIKEEVCEIVLDLQRNVHSSNERGTGHR